MCNQQRSQADIEKAKKEGMKETEPRYIMCNNE